MDVDDVTAPAGTRRQPHWFEAVADRLGSAYLRYSFTRGTQREIDALWPTLGLRPGCTVLDVGCGPGRHSAALAERGARVVGIDISERFLQVAREHGTAPGTEPGTAGGSGPLAHERGTGDSTEHGPAGSFVRADARRLPFAGCFDAAISLCQGAFGLNRTPEPGRLPLGPDPDEQVLAAVGTALRPGGVLALTAFSAYFQVRELGDDDRFDPATGCNHEHTEVRDEQGDVHPTDLYTTCFTPRELCLLAERAGLEVVDLWSVAPGDYAPRPPDLDHPEWLLIARRPD